MTLNKPDLDRIEGLAGKLLSKDWVGREDRVYFTPSVGGLSLHALPSGVDYAAYIAAVDPQTVLSLISYARELEADKARIDWLEQHDVNVRDPLVYGSRNMFWAGPSTEDGLTDPSDLRAQIDAALSRTQK